MPENIITKPGDQLRRAVQWVSDQKKANPGAKMSELIDKAGYSFDLSPKDLDFLTRKLT